MASTSSKGLFSASLISPTITSTLPSPYTIRPLERGDYAKGFLDCLRVLTDCGDVSEEKFLERYEFWEKVARETYFPLVIDDGKRICATGILLVERKL
jgi:glucosamine-phosphate N-acetyltransferase